MGLYNYLYGAFVGGSQIQMGHISVLKIVYMYDMFSTILLYSSVIVVSMQIQLIEI